MKLFTKAIEAKLLANGKKTADGNESPDTKPVTKLFTPDANCTWLLSELDPYNPDIAFGLCDLGMGYPELGYVSIKELTALRGKYGLPVERDRHFTASKSLVEYAEAARVKGSIEAY